MNQSHYQNTLRIVKILQELRCPVCGRHPQIKMTSTEKYDVRMSCHPELDDLIAQTEKELYGHLRNLSDTQPQ